MVETGIFYQVYIAMEAAMLSECNFGAISRLECSIKQLRAELDVRKIYYLIVT
jgi:hypothetical protein